MLPRHASEPAGADGVPPVSVALIARSLPSRSITAHHILVVPVTGRNFASSLLAAAAQVLSSAFGSIEGAIWAKAIAPKLTAINAATATNPSFSFPFFNTSLFIFQSSLGLEKSDENTRKPDRFVPNTPFLLAGRNADVNLLLRIAHAVKECNEFRATILPQPPRSL